MPLPYSLLSLLIASSVVACGSTPPIGHGGAGGCSGSQCGGAGGSAGTPADAGPDVAPEPDGGGIAPPPGCLPSCLEDAIRQCVPTFGACVTSTETLPPDPVAATVTRTCDLASGWMVVESARYPNLSRTLVKDGQDCFARVSQIRNIGGQPEEEITFFSFGQRVARGGTILGSTAVACGDGPFVRLDEPSAECAPWRDLLTPTPTCTSTSAGVCP